MSGPAHERDLEDGRDRITACLLGGPLGDALGYPVEFTHCALRAALQNGRIDRNTSKGCGAVMRSAPIGLGAGSIEDAFQLARDSARDTHGHPSGYLAAAYFAALIQRLVRGETLPEAMVLADG